MGWHFPEQSQGRIVSTPWVSVEASRQAGGRAGRRVRRMGPPLRNTRGMAGNTGRVECWQQLGGKGWGRGDPVEQICVPLEGGRQEKSILVTVLVMFTETAIVIVPQGIQLLIRKVKKIRRWMVVTAGTTHECTQSH